MRILAAAALFLAWVPAARAQQDDQLEGINGTQYNIKQSIEIGGRITDISGNQAVYDTFVNLQSGARLLGFTTEMRSLDNHGSLFDRLYVSAFGWGGDPNDVTRVRISKNTWYNFDATVRRDVNTWDYSLLANPMNPTNGFVNGPAGYGPLATTVCTGCIVDTSPHLYDTRRYLSDYNLLFLPQGKVRLRMGYSRNIISGPAMSTIHLGTDQLLTDQVRTTVNTYRLGVDYRAIPRTNISYDQIWTDYKGDTGAIDENQLFPLANGTRVDLGVPFNSVAGQPCNPTFVAPPSPPNVVNPACSAVINYTTHGRVRTNSPTEQISMQSNYWKNVDISGRFAYTGASTYDHSAMENFFGRLSRTNNSNYLSNYNVIGQRVAGAADLGVTWHITNAWSFLDSFHWSNFHNPVQNTYDNCAFFSANLLTAARFFTPVSPLPVTCVPPTGVTAGTPTHASGSDPDVVLDVNSGFLKQDEKMNLVEIDYQHSNRFGARIGFRYWHRDITDKSFANNEEFFFPSTANRGDCAITGGVLNAGCTAIGGGAFRFITPTVVVDVGNTEINQYSGLFGFWARPTKNWRISFDTELASADNVYTRISPRQFQEYRIRSSYKLTDWANLSGSIRDWEGRDNVTGINNLQHDRSYGLSALIQPNQKFAVDITYDYSNVFSQILICYPNAGLTVPSLNPCPGLAAGSGFVQNLSSYENRSHYGAADVLWRPIPKLTMHLGGNFTGTSGFVLIINPPNQIPGSLNSKWLTPMGGLEYAFSKNWTGRAFWNYYGYHEDPVNSVQDIFAPRNFHSNNVTLSARFAF
jgi:hypothetical protein